MAACERPHMRFLDVEYGRRTVNRHNYLPEPSRPGSELEALRKAREVARKMHAMKQTGPSSAMAPRDTAGKSKSSNTAPDSSTSRDPPTFGDGDELAEEVFDIYTTTDWPIIGHGDPFEQNGSLMVEVDWKPLLIPESALKYDTQAERHFVELEQGRRFWCSSWTQSEGERIREVVKVAWLSTTEPWLNINQPEDTLASIEREDDDSSLSGEDSDRKEHISPSRDRNEASCWVQGSRDGTGEALTDQQALQSRRIWRRRNSLDDMLSLVPTDAASDYDLVSLIESTKSRLNQEVSQGIRPKQQHSHRDLAAVLGLPRIRPVLFSAYAVSRRLRWNCRRQNKALATVVQAVGTLREPCERCQRNAEGGPAFQGCVTLDIDGRAVLNGSCACCYYHEKNKCRYRVVSDTCDVGQEPAMGVNQELDDVGRATDHADPGSSGCARRASEGNVEVKTCILRRPFASEPRGHPDFMHNKRGADCVDGVTPSERPSSRLRTAPSDSRPACNDSDNDRQQQSSADVNAATGMVSPPPSSPAMRQQLASSLDLVEGSQQPEWSNARAPHIKVEQLETPPNSQQEQVNLGVFDLGPGATAMVFKDDLGCHLSEAQVRWLFRQCTPEDTDDIFELRERYLEYEAMEAVQGMPSTPYQFLQEDEFGRRKVRSLIRILCPKRSDIVDLDLDSPDMINIKIDSAWIEAD